MAMSECYVPANSRAEILTPRVKVLKGGASGRWLGHEGRVFMNGISALIKETRERSLALFTTPGHSEKSAIPEDGSSLGTVYASTMTLDFPASRIKCLLFISHLGLWNFVIAA